MEEEELTPEEQAALNPDEPYEPPEEAEPEPVEPDEEPEAQEAEPEPKKDKPPEGYVPHGALHESHLKTKHWRERAQSLEKRLEEVEKKFQQPEAPPPEWADPLTDPDDHRKWLEYRLNSQRQQFEQFQQHLQQEREEQERIGRLQQYATRFAEQQPDYPQATQHLYNARAQAMAQMGMPQEQIQQQIDAEARQVFQAAEKARINPAQLFYQMAVEQGYRPQQQSNEAQRLSAVSEAQKNARGMGSAGGGAQGGKPTLKQIASWSEDRIAKELKKNPHVLRDAGL